MVRPKILITHNDLDGVGCAVVYLKAFPNTHVYFTNYDQVNDLIAEIITQGHEHWASEVVITDMSPNDSMAELLNTRGNVSLIDHHATALHFMDKYPWAVVDTEYSATKLVFTMLSNTHLMDDCKTFVELVDNYDMWGYGKGPSEKAHELNSLLWSIGQERFLKRFSKVITTELSPTELMIIQLEEERKQKYIAEALPEVNILQDTEGQLYGMIAAEQYSSSLGNEILKHYTEIEYVIMINFLTNKASLRGRGNVDMGKLAKQLGGGGHPKAAGFPLEQAALKYFYGGQ